MAAQLRAAGLAVGLCLTPLLPLADPAAFAERVIAFRPDVLVVQDFHDAGGRFGADTGDEARCLLAESGWAAGDYHAFVEPASESSSVRYTRANRDSSLHELIALNA